MRSNKVLYGVVGAVFLACTGGFLYDRFGQRRTCVDPQTSQVVESSRCDRPGPYRWYYGGNPGGLGTKVTGGSYERGGFGRVFSGGGGG
ncbi:MAG TPA: hypothetical protein VF163_04545 [Micromonosporaceae bacterium]